MPPKVYSGATPRHDLPERIAARSKLGDPIRQGRVESPPLVPDDQAGVLRISPAGVLYREHAAYVAAMLGVIEVGYIIVTGQGAGVRYAWTCFLPGCRPTPQPAATLHKACDALDYAVRGWLEAACLLVSPGQRARLHRARERR